MERPERQEPLETDSVRPLEYRDGAADREAGSGVQVVVGFLAGILVILVALIVGIVCSVGLHSGFGLVLICFLCSAVVVNLLAAVNYSRPPTRGFGIGLWIGFGVAAVGFAACLVLPR